MAETGFVYGDKAFFADPRTQSRRLGVSSHPEVGVVVLSLWEGEQCRATFRLPMGDAPALIGVLAGALGAAVEVPEPPEPPDPEPPPPAPTAGTLRRIK